MKERFPFGFGLSYAHFTYSDLTLDEKGASFTLTNDSDRDGSTVAQLYVQAPEGEVLRPLRELKGFNKVNLKAGQTTTVHIDFDQTTFRHFDAESDSWQTETGDWTIMIGSDARSMELTGTLPVKGTVEPRQADPALGAYLTGKVKDATD